MEGRDTGLLEYWRIEIQEYRKLEYGTVEIQEYRNTGGQIYRCIGTRESRDTVVH